MELFPELLLLECALIVVTLWGGTKVISLCQKQCKERKKK